jgi:hypothetical protein
LREQRIKPLQRLLQQHIGIERRIGRRLRHAGQNDRSEPPFAPGLLTTPSCPSTRTPDPRGSTALW